MAPIFPNAKDLSNVAILLTRIRDSFVDAVGSFWCSNRRIQGFNATDSVNIMGFNFNILKMSVGLV